MNTNKGGVGRAKHRQAYGHDLVSRHVKLALERWSNRVKRAPSSPKMSVSIGELFAGHRKQRSQK